MILPIDLQAEYFADKAEIDRAIANVLASGHYILGTEVEGFEREFAQYVGSSHAIGVASGTDALVLALKAIGVGHGDYVITVSHTAVATVAAIELAGAVPVFADVDERLYTMCPESLKRVIGKCRSNGYIVKAIVPVHLYGQVCDMESIQAIADEFDLRIVEDCSQSHGAGTPAGMTGTLGDVAAFSLYPTKNLAALGDAGIVTTQCDEIADRLRLLRQYGWRTRNLSELPGMNSRLDELQAAILRVRLRRLQERTERRRQIAAVYDSTLSEKCEIPKTTTSSEHVFHQYVIRTKDRDGVRKRMLEAGVTTLIHYPVPVHLQPAYRDRTSLSGADALSGTERIAGEILSLPIYPQLSDNSVHQVADTLLNCLP